jgi:hypothetical protein
MEREQDPADVYSRSRKERQVRQGELLREGQFLEGRGAGTDR